jgi:arylsulfatase A-like enzyme
MPNRVPVGVFHDVLVSSVDLFPTLLDYAGIEIPEHVAGMSLRPFIEGRAEWSRTQVIGGLRSVRGAQGEPRTEKRGPAFFLRSRRWHYIQYLGGNEEELFDLRADPDETRDLAHERLIETALFRVRIQDWRRRMEGLVEATPEYPTRPVD